VLTRRGAGLLTAAGVLLVASWLVHYQELAVLGTAALCALLICALWLLPSTELMVEREIAPPKATRGEEAMGLLRLANPGPRRSRAHSAVDRLDDTDVRVEVPPLPPGIVKTLTYRVPTHRRGAVQVGPLRLVQSDPLGLFQRRIPRGQRSSLLVRPRVLVTAPSVAGRAASLDGPDSDASASGTVTFHSLRAYEFGDDLRHIHWRTTARLGTLMVRRLVDAGEPRTIILLDTDPRSFQNSEMFELAVDTVASIAVTATRQGFPVTVHRGDRPLIATRGGATEAEAVLDTLALVAAEEGDGVLRSLRTVRAGGARGALVVVTGQPIDEVYERTAAAATGFDRTTLIRVARALPPAPESPAVRVVDIASAADFETAWAREARI
jgi:uncharacterized protein (DUF58 family)